MVASISREQALNFRVRAQQLDREHGRLADTAVLDHGVQDTGADGGLWALANRGLDPAQASPKLATSWTIRAAPHLYRRADLPSIAAAVEPFSDVDAGKRIVNASKPLKAAGIANLAALDEVAAAMRSVVTEPMVKGEVSGRLATMLPAPYLRYCQPCQATHPYEMLFRIAALRAGLQLRTGTSPPVLEPIPGFTGPKNRVSDRFDVVRGYLRLLGPATPKHVAAYLDAPLADVKARWPTDVVEVRLGDESRWLLAEDVRRLTDAPVTVNLTRLLGPYDLFLQAKDRELLIDDPVRAKALWPVLGRPGAVLVDGAIVGAWRPRKSGQKLTVAVQLWGKAAVRDSITEQAERLAAHRQVQLTGVDFTS